MLHVTIKDTEKNEVIFDREVKVIALQAVDESKTSRIRFAIEDVELTDLLLCARTIIKEATEAKKLLSEAITQAVSEADLDEGNIN